MTCNHQLDYQSNNALCFFCLPADVALKSKSALELASNKTPQSSSRISLNIAIRPQPVAARLQYWFCDAVTHHQPLWSCLAVIAAAEAMG
jgi:hypothetical protein